MWVLYIPVGFRFAFHLVRAEREPTVRRLYTECISHRQIKIKHDNTRRKILKLLSAHMEGWAIFDSLKVAPCFYIYTYFYIGRPFFCVTLMLKRRCCVCIAF
jgi:hypothetical protein